MRWGRLFIMIGIFCWARLAHAYPEFIGYGYTTCATCHYNGLGGGPLSDYGRALWSSEIASRAFYPKGMSEDQIVSQSGFLGSVPLPVWVRPHLKYRGLDLQTGPGSSNQQSHYYHMQADAGVTLQSDDVGTYLFSITFGRVVRPEDYAAGKDDLNRILPREYFFRTEIVPSWWVYAGLMEKVFGLRNIDHTSFQRTYQGFNEQPDTADGMSQSQGVIVQKSSDYWELNANAFFGNPAESTQYREKGASLMGEYEIGEKKRLGASVLSAKSDVLKKDLYAVHYRQGLSKGSALMLEWGLINDQPAVGESAVGSYNLIQSLISLTRGYNLKATIERYNREFKASEPDQWKWSVGLLMFPLPRLELRTDLATIRMFSNQNAPEDQWMFMEQLHVSL